ncbi:Na+/H+ antiporter [Nocardioides sp.]|uniref:Na+/H+ antiporter n=1 Tax=Nocardioides sp. TaxID=35761 RepID=UPI003784D130
MSEPWVMTLLLAAVMLFTPVADQVKVPQPVLLTIFGVGVGLVPATAPLDFDPELILPVVLPPLLFAATQRTTATEFREQARPVLVLAVGLTVATAAVVAVVAHRVGVPWAAAWVLGAIVSPPDPVAATAVARRLRLPHRLVTILEGEGMFNDATALVMYHVALVAVVAGDFSALDAGVELVAAVVVGVGAGLALGWVVTWLLAHVQEAYTETTITVVAPFVAYLGAERLGGSGVLAVLVLGLYLRNAAHEATTSRGWLLGRSVWSYADFLITSMAFAVLGFELSAVTRTVVVTRDIVVVGTAVILTVVLFRIAWMFPVTWWARRVRAGGSMPTDWRETTVVAWSGMRGVVTVATALALPMATTAGAPLPDRDLLLVTALACVLVTLVLQGLTLSPLTRRLGVASEVDHASEVAALRVRAADAALDHVRGDTGAREDVRRAAELQYAGYLEAQRAMADARRSEMADDAAEELDELLGRATAVERRLVLDERRLGRVSAGTADEVLRDIESRSVRDIG